MTYHDRWLAGESAEDLLRAADETIKSLKADRLSHAGIDASVLAGYEAGQESLAEVMQAKDILQDILERTELERDRLARELKEAQDTLERWRDAADELVSQVDTVARLTRELVETRAQLTRAEAQLRQLTPLGGGDA